MSAFTSDMLSPQDVIVDLQECPTYTSLGSICRWVASVHWCYWSEFVSSHYIVGILSGVGEFPFVAFHLGISLTMSCLLAALIVLSLSNSNGILPLVLLCSLKYSFLSVSIRFQ